MAAMTAVPCVSFARLSISCSCSSSSGALSAPAAVAIAPLRSCGFFSSSLSKISVGRLQCQGVRCRVVIRGMAEKARAPPAKKKEDSAKKRARLAEERRIFNKSRRTQIKTRMKKVFLALESLRKTGGEERGAIKPVEVLIGEAYSIIDKSVKVGTLHKNTGGRRKARLARAKRAVEIELGWFTPTPVPV